VKAPTQHYPLARLSPLESNPYGSEPYWVRTRRSANHTKIAGPFSEVGVYPSLPDFFGVRKKLVYAIVAVAILAVGGLYLSGFQAYQNQSSISGNLVRSPSPEWSALYFKGPSGEVLADFNFSTTLVDGNGTRQGVSFGFLLWHATGFNIERVNMTFAIGPSPADVWVTAFNYDTGGYPSLDFENANFSGGPTGVSGAVVTLSAFPPPNPTTEYGVGLAYKNAELPAAIGSTSVSVQLVLSSGSGIPFAGDTYTGQFGFNLVYVPE
jgi:hypothetical protein